MKEIGDGDITFDETGQVREKDQADKWVTEFAKEKVPKILLCFHLPKESLKLFWSVVVIWLQHNVRFLSCFTKWTNYISHMFSIKSV